ncbi:MAG: hypothetical protein JRM77_06975 [Nitrososphaerota archaeon]|nr:hypothetical protein [Nitrososphaerota archaeon]
MNLRLNMAWGLLDALGVSVFMVVFVHPKSFPVVLGFAAVFVMEISAFTFAYLLAKGTKSFMVLKTLLLAVLMSAFIVLFLGGALGFDATFLILLALQFAGLLSAEMLTRRERR